MRVVNSKTLWEGKFLKTVLITYEDRTGALRQWEAVRRRDYSDVVVIIPITRRNDLVLIRQYRPVLDCSVIELPAGLVEPGEDIIDAGRRELVEETGLVSDSISLLSEGVLSTGINMEKWRILIAKNVEEAPEEILRSHPRDDNEDIEVIKVPLSHVYEALEEYRLRGDEIDLRIFGLLDLAKRKLHI
ncbi:MAG: NUDIX hydrolase [bacterium]